MSANVKKLFVTGCYGFVGGWVRRLAADIQKTYGYEIVIPPSDFDLFEPAALDSLLSRHEPEAILHLAGQPSVARSYAEPALTLRTNLIGTLHLLESVQRVGIRPRILYPSSGEVYGLVQESAMPVPELCSVRPRSPYAVSKVAAEALCYQWQCTSGLEIIIARPFNHIGAGQSDSFALPSFAKQLAEIRRGLREPILSVGNLDVFRDFTHVADVVHAYLILLEKGISGEIYNVSAGEALSIRSLLEQMVKISKVGAEILVDPKKYRPSEQRAICGRNEKIRALGWAPRTPISSALQEIIDEWGDRLNV